jgi:aminomethyltransferase
MLPASMAGMAIKLLLKQSPGDAQAAVMQPCGLGARDTLRLEAGMPLYGHELDENIDPISADLNFAVNLNKDQDERGEKFIGQDALQKIAAAGPAKKRVGLRLEGKRTPRQGMMVNQGDQPIASVTSGCLSPTLGYPIAMTYLPSKLAVTGTELNVTIGSSRVPAQVVPLPFYKKS